MIAGKQIVSIVAIFILFFGIIGSLTYDALSIIAHPNGQTAEKVLKDIAGIVVNSQGEIAKAVDEFSTNISSDYATFLLGRIFVGSMVTIFMIWLFYKIFRFFVEAPKPTDKIIIILLSVFVVYIICVISSYYIGKPNWIPFDGWLKLAQNREAIASYIISHYGG